jgi:DEAD/DEAH box helicase domain-containing protein
MHTSSAWIDFDEERLDAVAGRPLSARLLYSIAYILRNIVPLFTLSDYGDIHVVHQTRSNYSGRPAVFLYDSVPGGVGITERAFSVIGLVASECVGVIERCACSSGCPGCVGPLPPGDDDIKGAVKKALVELLYEPQG